MTASSALEQAELARELLVSEGLTAADTAHRESIRLQAQRAAETLDRAAATSLDEGDRADAAAAAEALRALTFALEAERLLRDGAHPPTGEQLAQADEARRMATRNLDVALARLEQRVGRPVEGGR